MGIPTDLSGAGVAAVRGVPPPPCRPARVLLLRDVSASAEVLPGAAQTGRGRSRTAGGQTIQSSAAAGGASPPPAGKRQRAARPARLPPRRPAAVDRVE